MKPKWQDGIVGSICKILVGLLHRVPFLNKRLPDELYLKYVFYCKCGKKLDIRNPQTFNEKIQWLKLYDRKSEYTMMVDKCEVKKYVANLIGEEHIIPTLGVWESFDKIDFDKLPNQFVLKCTHDSGGVVICIDKSTLNKRAARKKLNKGLNRNYFWTGREWPYKNVMPRIIAETYLEGDVDKDLRDYKIHCFHGEPKYLQVIGKRDLSNHTGKQLFYTFGWEDAGWAFGDYPPYPYELERPKHLDEMYEVAKSLSRNIKYVRVDLYEINGQVYFGEITFHPASGFYQFNDYYNEETDLMLGSLINIE